MYKVVLAAAALAFSGPALAKEYAIKMLNKGAQGAMVFEPAFVRIAPGDTVRFVPTDKLHNAESIPTMLPEAARPFKGKMNQEIVVPFAKAGVYGIKCLPHFGMGMVALVQVGAASPNLARATAEAAKLPGLARARMVPMVTRAK